jgi:hypothetical protein
MVSGRTQGISTQNGCALRITFLCCMQIVDPSALAEWTSSIHDEGSSKPKICKYPANIKLALIPVWIALYDKSACKAKLSDFVQLEWCFHAT